jgi:hypothetical protein
VFFCFVLRSSLKIFGKFGSGSFGIDLRRSPITLISLLVGSGAGLSPVALSKSDSPEVTTSGFGFHSGDGSGINLFSGAENLNSLLLVIMVLVSVWSIARQQINALGS